ncbi:MULTISPECIES: carbohydrate ABC transporter permease [unclassified Arthrobacter]|uniref:carbohydrate ABC transporter permease n=1 Tax=unclassified Arthrobacter TaxID=235627 RepID=UPI001D1384D7|nr:MULTISPECIES: sugar ABC transporter permease [unclassified Arthrobacter]MCC3274677.1 sugar ABC transporter permease [Arthrobacter sp. zg-Y20]MCC9177735.1 sugar ABC transporter permease [Arthrobacter sp. zg-Y750]MDK1314833.1 sugar ABC transporter permease [Arthrobacter sp. zg.Y20]MDK1327694.1 sugar ABC transporter permease [Arthrobacter sp. zg-Y1143]WIB04695.1 sugar ABC transporter permease [Arthrobacter sp. zg-Y20]
MTVTVKPPAPAAPAPKPELSFRQRLNVWDFKVSPYLYISPFFLLFALVGLFPLIYTFFVSLYDWHLLKGQGDFVGLGNFADVLGDRFFWNSLFNTLSIFLLSAIPQLAGALLIAAVLDQNIRAKTFWRMSVLVPYVVTPVAVALIFTNMFGEEHGLINSILGNFGIDPIQWRTETFPSHVAVASMVNWRWTGYNALILLAAMQSVPREIYESAALDGAGAVRRFFSITLPSIRPTMIFVVITSTIGGLQIFTEPRLLDPTYAGGAQRQFQTTVLYLWEMAFQRQDFGRASAIAWLLFLLIVVFGVVNLALSRRIASSDSRRSRRRAALKGKNK